jgi:hypothetical protein
LTTRDDPRIHDGRATMAPMAPHPSDPELQTALAVVGYQWALRPEEFAFTDAIQALEALQVAASEVPTGPRPLADVYPHVARLAALGLGVLARLGDPEEVDGLHGFEGFGYWRESR